MRESALTSHRYVVSRDSLQRARWTPICSFSGRESLIRDGQNVPQDLFRETARPMNVKNILVTTDFSFQARKTYPCAANLARKFDATLHVAHVEDTLPPLFLNVSADAYFEELEKGVRKEAEDPAFEGVTVVPHLLRNRQPFEALNAIGRTENIDLIVIATHGRTGVQRFLLGSFAERVVRTSAIPVLVYRPKGAHAGGGAPERVLVPVDFSEKSMIAVPVVRFLSASYGSHFTFLFVDEPIPDHLPFFQRLREVLRGSPRAVEQEFAALKAKELTEVDITLETCEGVPYLEISRTAREIDADLVLISTRGVLGSVAQNVIRDAPCSVLTVRGEPGSEPQRRGGR